MAEAFFDLGSRHAVGEQFAESSGAGDVAERKVGQAMDSTHRRNQSGSFPAPDQVHGDAEQLAEHGGGVGFVDFGSRLVEAEQVQPLRFDERGQGQSGSGQFVGILPLDGGLSVGFQRPAFLTDDQHCGAACDVCG